MERFTFRAYHFDAKEMIPNNRQGFEGDVFNWAHQGQPVAIMQATGVCDANGTSIFEGDILEEEEGYLFEVVWDDTWAKFELQWRTKAAQYPGWNRGRQMRVIGNIHETPEMISSH